MNDVFQLISDTRSDAASVEQGFVSSLTVPACVYHACTSEKGQYLFKQWQYYTYSLHNYSAIIMVTACICMTTCSDYGPKDMK